MSRAFAIPLQLLTALRRAKWHKNSPEPQSASPIRSKPLFRARLAPSLLLAATLAASASAQDLTTGLVGRYPLDGTGQDFSPQNNPLVLTNVQPAPDRNGNVNGAVYLNGTSAWMVTTSDSPISGDQPRTLAVWVNSGEYTFYQGQPAVIGLGDKSGTGTLYDFSLSSTGQRSLPSTAFFVHGSWMEVGTTSPVVPHGVWTHIAVSTEGTLGGSRVYVNGIRTGANLGSHSPSLRYSTVRTKMRVSTGSTSSGPSNESFIWWNQGFRGSLDDIRIYNRQLSDAEVSALYAQTSTAPAGSVPAITTQPQAQTVAAGASATFTVAATSATPLSYQWRRNGTPIPGATAASYAFAATAADQGAAFQVVVSNTAGSVTSATASLAVGPAAAVQSVEDPSLLALFACDQPLADLSRNGASVVILNASFTPDRFGRPSQALRFDGSSQSVLFNVPNLPRGNAPRTLALWVRYERTSATLGNGNDHYAGWGSNAVRQAFGMFIGAGPFPLRHFGYLGTDDTDTTTAATSAWVHVAHTFDGATSRVFVNGTLTGQRVLTLDTTGGTLFSIGGRIATEVGTNAIRDFFAGAIDDVRLWSRSLTATEVGAIYAESTATSSLPLITTQPASQTVSVGQSLTLSVVASGAGTLAYQWLRNGTVLTGATTASYAVANATATDAGTYSVLVQNALGSVYTNPATVTVTNPVPTAVAPAITTQPQGRTVDAGTAVTLTVAATGTEPLAYQWLRNGTAVPGATAASLRIASAGPGDAGTYTARVANEQGTALSTPATLVVNQLAVQVTQDPTAPGVGSPVSLTAAASPAGTYRYQWLRNGQPLAGQTNATLTIAFATPANSGAYACVVTNAAGTSLTSTPRQLQVSTGSPELRIVNSSTRLFVGTGDQVLITGLVLEGSGARSLLVRAVGPGLNPFGVTGTLPDPQLTVYDSARRVVAANDDWTASLGPIMAQAGAFPLPATSRDSALVVSLSAGAYTFMVSGANNSSGTALLEVYELP
jgi:hypothetical protein